MSLTLQKRDVLPPTENSVEADLNIDFVDFRDCETLQDFLMKFSAELFATESYRYGKLNQSQRGLVLIENPSPNSAPYMRASSRFLEGRDLESLGEVKFVGKSMEEVTSSITAMTAFLPVQHLPFVRSQITAACLHFFERNKETYDFADFADSIEKDLAFGIMKTLTQNEFNDISLLIQELGMGGLIKEKTNAIQELSLACNALFAFSRTNDLGGRMNLKNTIGRFEDNDIGMNVWNTSVQKLQRLLQTATITSDLKTESSKLESALLDLIEVAETPVKESEPLITREQLRSNAQQTWLENMSLVIAQASQGRIDKDGLASLQVIQALVSHSGNETLQTDFISYLCSLNRYYPLGTLEHEVMMSPNNQVSQFVGAQVYFTGENNLLG